MKRKRIFSFILCALLLACLVPTAAFAADGANPQSAGGVFASVTLSGAADKVLFSADGAVESLILSADEQTEPRYRPIESAAYDIESNTLTLSNFAGEGVVLNLTMMGADFKLRLVGSSSLSAIRAESLGFGCSICFCGEGALTVTNPEGTAIYLDAGGAEDYVRVEAQASVTASSGQGGAIRVVNSPLGPNAIRFDTASPEVGPWDLSAPLTEQRTSVGATVDVYTLDGELYGLEAKIDEAAAQIVYDVYRLNGTDESGAYLAVPVYENVADISAYTPARSPHDISLYEIGGAAPVSQVRLARFTLRAYGSDDKGSVSISPGAVGRGGSATVSVQPAEGCKLKSLRINGEEVRPTDGVYTIGCVTEDITAQAVFSGAMPEALRVDAPAVTDFTVPADGAADFVGEPFVATVTDGGGDALNMPIDWSVSPHSAGVTIGSDGRVRVSNAAKDAVGTPIRYTVTAAVPGTDFTDSSQSFTVSRAPHAAHSVRIMRADVALEDGDTVAIPAAGGTTAAEYRAVVLDPYGEVVDTTVNWTAGDWPLGVERKGNVVYVADNCPEGSTLTLMASAASDGTVASMITIRFAVPTLLTAQSETHVDAVPAASAKALTDSMVTVSPEKLVYTGEALTPAVVVKDGETVLGKDTDYELAYADNTGPGTASVTVTGKGSYSGTVTKNFRIVTLEVSWPTVSEATDKNYGTALKDIISLSGGSASFGGEAVTGSFALKDEERIPPVGGSYRIVFRSEDGELVKESGDYTLTRLRPKTLSDSSITVSPSKMVYSGEALTPAVIVKDGETVLEKDVDYTVDAYADNTEISTESKKASVTVTGKGNYSGTVTKNFEITKIPASSLASGVLITPCKPDSPGKIPELKIKYGGKEFASSEYSVKYTFDIDKKTGIAEITFSDTHYEGSLTKEFNLPNYLIVEGAGGTWSKSTAIPLQFRANGAAGKCIGLTVDGAVVDAKYYSVESGSTVVKISADYLKTLTDGKHIVGIVYEDGKALAIFSVMSSVRRGVATGDGSNALAWVFLMTASLIALGILSWLFFRERRGKKKKKKKR